MKFIFKSVKEITDTWRNEMTEEKPILTEEQEKDMGVIQMVIDVAAKNVVGILVLAPTAYLIMKGMPVPEAWYAIVGGVVAYYFKK